MGEYISLHSHSTYSFLDGFGHPADLVARAKELGMPAIALTDHGSVSGHPILEKAALKEGVKPIFGAEFYTVPDVEANERQKGHITVLAANQEGYKNLLQLATLSYRKGFYYKPSIDESMLFEHQDGLLVFSGCWSGLFQRYLQQDDYNAAFELAVRFKTVFGDRFFLELQHYGLFKQTYQSVIDIGKSLRIPIVMTIDNHYLKPEQASIRELLWSIRDKRQFDPSGIVADAALMSFDEVMSFLKVIDPVIRWEPYLEVTQDIADRCSVTLQKGSLPAYRCPDGKNPYRYLAELCAEGMKQRGIYGKTEYRERMIRELELIHSKQFEDYFLLVWDAINWAKANGIMVGPGRGSSGGSLVAYSIGITHIDPIKYDLLFERFIDETRIELPDIDIDFEDEKRYLVRDYLKQKYGESHVVQLGTFAQFKGKNALDEVGKCFSIPASKVETVKTYLIDRSGGDQRAQLSILDTFEMAPAAKEIAEEYPDILYAAKLEGQYRHQSSHAAGVLISASPIDQLIAFYRRGEKDTDEVASVDMDGAKYLDLLKIDLLGLTELTMLREIFEMNGKTAQDVYNIPIDDEATLQAFKVADVLGVFQAEGESTKSILRQMNTDKFEDVIDAISLSKPGPSHCLDGNSIIYDCDSGQFLTISKAYKNKISSTLTLFPDGRVAPQCIKRFHKIGSRNKNKQKVYRVKLQDSKALVATSEHWFLTTIGWKQLADLNPGDEVICSLQSVWNCGATIGSSPIVSIEFVSEEVVYDLEMEVVPNYIANGMVVHNSGSASAYLIRKNGGDAEGFEFHPALLPITKPTYGQILYQEQVIRIAREIGKFGITEANRLRVIIAKSEGREIFETYWEIFEKGAAENGMDSRTARRLWEGIKTHGQYGFNRCVSGKTKLYLGNGNQFTSRVVTIEQLWKNKQGLDGHKHVAAKYKQFGLPNILSLCADGKIRPSKVKDVVFTGIKPIYRVTTEGGKAIDATVDHRFLTQSGWKTLKDVVVGESLLVCDFERDRHPMHSNRGRKAHFAHGYRVLQDTVVSFDYLGEEETYDIEMESQPNFLANQIVVHNSHSAVYALITYWSMYTKTHFPLHFYLTHIRREGDDRKKRKLMQEAIRKGFQVLGPRFGYSKGGWSIDQDGNLRAGLMEIRGIAVKTAEPIEELGHFTSIPESLPKRIRTIVEKNADFFDEKVDYFALEFDPKIVNFQGHKCNDIDWDDQSYPVQMAGMLFEMNMKDHKEELQSRGKDTSNISYPELLKYCMLMFEDDTDTVMLQVNRFAYPKLQDVIWDAFTNKKPVRISGTKIKGWRIVGVKDMRLL